MVNNKYAQDQIKEICVAHLVRAQNGIEPFKRFLESYTRCNGGIDHDFLVIFKGFKRVEDIAGYSELLKRFSYKHLFVHDYGFDIRAYSVAAKTFKYKYFCFLNSYSYFLDKEWLMKMYKYISKQGVGLVGASGSYESRYTNFLNAQSKNNAEPFYKHIMKNLKQWKKLMRRKYFFDPFPNYHIRTNGFMISRDAMRKLRYGFILNKMDAYRFESGKNSLSKQILRMNLNILVVGKDGKAYEKEEWYKSDTFRHGAQSNLMIADNQTDLYLSSDSEKKQELSQYAWGDKACP